MIFTEKGVYNRAGKTDTKIGIYSKPPPKKEIYGYRYKIVYNFVIFGPQFRVKNFFPAPFFLKYIFMPMG
jgi:hypothetical protein